MIKCVTNINTPRRQNVDPVGEIQSNTRLHPLIVNGSDKTNVKDFSSVVDVYSLAIVIDAARETRVSAHLLTLSSDFSITVDPFDEIDEVMLDFGVCRCFAGSSKSSAYASSEENSVE